MAITEAEAKASMERMVQDHEKRILALEQNYSEVKKDLTAVQTSQLEIKSTLLQTNMEQQRRSEKQAEEQKQMIEKQTQEQGILLNKLLAHTLGIKDNNNNKKWELLLALFGGGGLIFGLVQLALNYL